MGTPALPLAGSSPRTFPPAAEAWPQVGPYAGGAQPGDANSGGRGVVYRYKKL